MAKKAPALWLHLRGCSSIYDQPRGFSPPDVRTWKAHLLVLHPAMLHSTCKFPAALELSIYLQ